MKVRGILQGLHCRNFYLQGVTVEGVLELTPGEIRDNAGSHGIIGVSDLWSVRRLSRILCVLLLFLRVPDLFMPNALLFRFLQ